MGTPAKKKRGYRQAVRTLGGKKQDAMLRVATIAPLIALGLPTEDACRIAGTTVWNYYAQRKLVKPEFYKLLTEITETYNREFQKAKAWADALNTLVSLSACEAMLSKVMADRDLDEGRSCEEKSVSMGAECPVCAYRKLTSAATELYKPIACTPASVVEHPQSPTPHAPPDAQNAPPRHKRPPGKGKTP